MKPVFPSVTEPTDALCTPKISRYIFYNDGCQPPINRWTWDPLAVACPQLLSVTRTHSSQVGMTLCDKQGHDYTWSFQTNSARHNCRSWYRETRLKRSLGIAKTCRERKFFTVSSPHYPQFKYLYKTEPACNVKFVPCRSIIESSLAHLWERQISQLVVRRNRLVKVVNLEKM